MSEHVEMYLVMIALLRDDTQTPVPLSLLAQKLAISAVSVNEMCRKLDEQGMVQYQPYKGVTLTLLGEAEAQAILSRRRLWVVFLVQELGIEPDEADEIACRLEHVTSERLVAALKTYLERAPAQAGRTSAPVADETAELRPLATYSAGQQGIVATLDCDAATADFLHAQGLLPGVALTVLATGSDGSLLLEVGARRLALATALAGRVNLAPPVVLDPPCTWAKCRAFWGDTADVTCPRLVDLQPVAERMHT